MTIIRSKITQDFTILRNSLINDPGIDTKYLGCFLRLISKGENWEISVDGLATLYPTNGVDYYRSALKHFCKLGYLIRIPQKRLKGQFQKSVMELYDTRQIQETLSDETVDKLFSKEVMEPEEIKIIYPHWIFPNGLVNSANPTQQRTYEPRIERNSKQESGHKEKPPFSSRSNAAAVFPISQKAREALTQAGFNSLEFDSLNQYCFSEEQITAAAQKSMETKPPKGIGWIVKCIRESWYDESAKEDVAKLHKDLVFNNLIKLDGQKLQGFWITISNNYIEFVSGQKVHIFNYAQQSFKSSLKAFFEKYEIDLPSCLMA